MSNKSQSIFTLAQHMSSMRIRIRIMALAALTQRMFGSNPGSLLSLDEDPAAATAPPRHDWPQQRKFHLHCSPTCTNTHTRNVLSSLLPDPGSHLTWLTSFGVNSHCTG